MRSNVLSRLQKICIFPPSSTLLCGSKIIDIDKFAAILKTLLLESCLQNPLLLFWHQYLQGKNAHWTTIDDKALFLCATSINGKAEMNGAYIE
jgi:hypothetical protein